MFDDNILPLAFFILNPNVQQPLIKHGFYNPFFDENYESAPNDTLVGNNIYHFELECVRNQDQIHYYFYIYYDLENKKHLLEKIGQYPSMADIEISQYHRYSKLLSQNYISEFNKAIGLSAHGVGIGSFVYLRRVFENLIGNYYEKAKISPSWDDDKYSKGRMEDKIKLLSEYLPDAVVEFRSFYSIVSKGVHELTDKECLKYFPIVKDAVLAMLEQDYLLTENEKKQKELRENMNKLKSELGKK